MLYQLSYARHRCTAPGANTGSPVTPHFPTRPRKWRAWQDSNLLPSA